MKSLSHTILSQAPMWENSKLEGDLSTKAWGKEEDQRMMQSLAEGRLSTVLKGETQGWQAK